MTRSHLLAFAALLITGPTAAQGNPTVLIGHWVKVQEHHRIDNPDDTLVVALGADRSAAVMWIYVDFGADSNRVREGRIRRGRWTTRPPEGNSRRPFLCVELPDEVLCERYSLVDGKLLWGRDFLSRRKP